MFVQDVNPPAIGTLSDEDMARVALALKRALGLP